MMYRVLADALVVMHFLFIVFVIFGAWLTLRWHWMPWLHLPAAAWGGFVELTGGICPLTPLENELRTAAGDTGYSGGYVEHYLIPLIYPGDLTPDLQILLGALVILVNAIAYGVIWRARR